MDRLYSLLIEYIDKLRDIDSTEELAAASAALDDAPADEDGRKLIDGIKSLADELVSFREQSRIGMLKTSGLSDEELRENAQVQRLLDLNLLTYFFQPIIDAQTGEIYSYEALMRAKDMQGISPYHILRYAELSDRLYEVEQYTFLNVLNFLKAHRDLFGGRPIFINSIPSVKILPEKQSEINRLLSSLSDSVVVEMTENTKFGEDELKEMKARYNRLNVRIAIDDFGTGYSNISNLLRYTPNYVKIDRALISDVNSDPNKKHFVREIIEFCHANDILVLAEGVENEDEMRAVILMGIDLIQGFYTAKPSPDVITSVPYKIRSEICMHRQEREDGKRINVYSADSREKVSLSRLKREGYTRLHIGSFDDAVVTVIGEPSLYTDTHVTIADDFSGKVVLKDCVLANTEGRPCIAIGENCDVSVILIGTSKMINSGIRVPASSSLTIEGKGNLDIELSSSDYYGIGNDMASHHGDLIFDQDGTISISGASSSGVCIGSGLGGAVIIKRGRYVLNAMGSMIVCIGSHRGSTSIDITGCDLSATAKGTLCSSIGSLYGESVVHMIYSSIHCTVNGQTCAVVGTIYGDSARVYAESVNISISANADIMTAYGSIHGSSDIFIERSSSRTSMDGPEALLFGGTDGRTKLGFTDADISADIASSTDTITNALPDHTSVSGGRFRIRLNDDEYDRLLFDEKAP